MTTLNANRTCDRCGATLGKRVYRYTMCFDCHMLISDGRRAWENYKLEKKKKTKKDIVNEFMQNYAPYTRVEDIRKVLEARFKS